MRGGGIHDMPRLYLPRAAGHYIETTGGGINRRGAAPCLQGIGIICTAGGIKSRAARNGGNTGGKGGGGGIGAAFDGHQGQGIRARCGCGVCGLFHVLSLPIDNVTTKAVRRFNSAAKTCFPALFRAFITFKESLTY
jgi:hypothetical protein